MRYSILTIITIFCLGVMPCSAEFRGNIVQTGVVNGIQTGDDGKLNSLGVNYDASGEAGTLTLDKIEAGDSGEPVVIQLDSASTSTNILELKDATGDTEFFADKYGQVGSRVSFQTGTFEPYYSTANWQARLRDDSKLFIWQDQSDSTIASMTSTGTMSLQAIQPTDSSSAIEMRLPSGSSSAKTLSIQDDTGTEKAYFEKTGLLLCPVSYIGVMRPQFGTNDLQLRLRDDTKKFAFQNSSANDTFTFSLDGDDRVMSFIGGTNTGEILLDDSTNRIVINNITQVNGSIVASLNVDAGVKVDTPKIEVDTITDRAGTGAPSATYGINYPTQTAPSAPASGWTAYTDSSDSAFGLYGADGRRFGFSQSGSGSDIDPILSFYDSSGVARTIYVNDGANTFQTNYPFTVSGAVKGQPVESFTHMLSADGYYGPTTSDPAEFPEGLQTTSGSGIGIGVESPDDNQLLFADASDVNTPNPGDGYGYIIYKASTDSFYFRKGTATANSEGANLLCSDLYALRLYSYTGQPVYANANIELASGKHLTNDGLGLNYIGYDGTTINRFNYGYFANLNVSNAVNSAIFRPAASGADVRIQARTDTGNGVVLFQEYDSSVDRMKVTTDVPAAGQVDTYITFYGELNNATLFFDDNNDRITVPEDLYAAEVIGTRCRYSEIVNPSNDAPPAATYWLTDGTADDATVTDSTFDLTTAHYTTIVDASSNAVQLNLPASPEAGDIHCFYIKDNTNTITISRNGNTIMWAASDYTLTESKTFTWADTENTWLVK